VIEPVKIGVVLGFARLDQAVIDRLLFGKMAGLFQEPSAGLCERDGAKRFFARDFKRAFRDKGLPPETPEVAFHARGVARIGVTSQVWRRNHAEFAEFPEGVEFG
jgi:hypothetical protein